MRPAQWRRLCGVQHPGDDPDLGDQTVGFGDRLLLTFDRATDRGAVSVGGPFAAGEVVPRAVVDQMFNFSHVVGRDYSG